MVTLVFGGTRPVNENVSYHKGAKCVIKDLASNFVSDGLAAAGSDKIYIPQCLRNAGWIEFPHKTPYARDATSLSA
jgi:hypothetical protein